jgi:hypothetical protein
MLPVGVNPISPATQVALPSHTQPVPVSRQKPAYLRSGQTPVDPWTM